MTNTATNIYPGASSPNSTHDEAPAYVSSGIRGWCGRGVSALGNGVSALGNGVSSLGNATVGVFQQTVVGLDRIMTSTNDTANVFRKLPNILKLMEHLSGFKGSLSRLSKHLGRNVAVIDFFQLAADINYFAGRRFKEEKNEEGKVLKPRDNNVVISGKLAFLTANTGGVLLWLEEMSFVSLSHIGKAIGDARVFSFVPKVVSSVPVLRDVSTLQNIAKTVGEFRAFSFVKHLKCLSITLRAVDLGYALFAVDASRRLIHASNKTQAISAGLDLSSYLAELTLSAIIFAGVTNVIGLGVAGSACVTLTVSSLMYRVTHEKEIKQPAQQPVVV